MKIRNGFVSNSSSSSFIIKLDYVPSSTDELKKMIYGDNAPEFIINWDDEGFSTDRLCDIVYNDINNAINDENDAMEHISVHKYNSNEYKHLIDVKYIAEYNKLEKNLLSLSNSSRFYDIKDPGERAKEIRKHYNKYNKLTDKMKKIVIDSLQINKKESDIIIKLEYSDNEGSVQSFIEHSEFLDPITLIKISNH